MIQIISNWPIEVTILKTESAQTHDFLPLDLFDLSQLLQPVEDLFLGVVWIGVGIVAVYQDPSLFLLLRFKVSF